MSSLSSKHRFIWSSKELTLRQLAADYRHLLPFPVIVTHGCSRRKQPKLSPSEHEAYWIHDVVKCPCVVVEYAPGKLMKIPECYETMVTPIKMDGKEGEAFPFNEIRVRTGFRYFRFVDPQQEVFTEDAQQVKDSALTQYLKVVDVFDQDMLVVHSIFMENLMAPCRREGAEVVEHKVVPRCFKLLPTYLPVTVSAAVSLVSAPEINFFKTVADMKMIVDSYHHNYELAIREAAEIVLVTAQTDDPVYCQLDDVNQVLDPGVGQLEEAALLKQLERIHIFCSTGRIVDGEPEASSPADNTLRDTMPQASHELAEYPRLKDRVTKIKMMTRSASDRALDKACGRSDGLLKPESPGTLPGAATRTRRVSVGSLTGNPVQPPNSPLQHRLVSELKFTVTRNRSSNNLLQSNQQTSPLASLGSRHQCFGSNNDVADDVSDMSVEQLADFLVLLKLSKYSTRMRDNLVDGKLLKCLNENILKNQFGFNDADAAKLMTFTRRGSCT